MYGPPVNPPQPELGLTAAFGGKTDWQTSAGEDRYRRGIYTSWRRSNPYPSMATFDAPNREVCTLRRLRTNTPLQALVTLNDPVYVEAAQALARMMAEEQTVTACIEFGFKRTLQRDPSHDEVSQLAQLYEDAFNQLREDPAAAKKLAEDPLGPLSDQHDPIKLATLTVIANVLLNLDEYLMPR